jgi:hypothetical protein
MDEGSKDALPRHFNAQERKRLLPYPAQVTERMRTNSAAGFKTQEREESSGKSHSVEYRRSANEENAPVFNVGGAEERE